MKTTSEQIEDVWKTKLEVGPFACTSSHTDLKQSIISAHAKMLNILFNYKNS